MSNRRQIDRLEWVLYDGAANQFSNSLSLYESGIDRIEELHELPGHGA